MPPGRDRTATSEPEVTFEVERFGVTSGDRLEIAGRWFGVRGRRFLRPTLELEVDGRRRRVLALLEHKPWAAEEGEEWLAAFTWDGQDGDPGNAELAVGADLAVEVSPPGKRARKARGRPSAEARELKAARAELERKVGELERSRDAHAAEREEYIERLTAEQRANRELQSRLDAARARTEETDRELEVLRGELARLTGELGKLQVAREAAVVARDAAIADSENLERERETAVRAGAAAVAQLEGAAGAAQRAEAERDDARGRLRRVTAERDAAVAARDSASAERDAARSERAAEPAKPRPPAPVPVPLPTDLADDSPPALSARTTRLIAVAAVAIPLLILALLIAFAF